MIAFNPDLSRKIYAGADLFLMPSKSEPCGLSQMIACRYGTVPSCEKRADCTTVSNLFRSEATGLPLLTIMQYDMLYVIREAIACYQNKEFWPELVKRVMNSDFSWQRSAGEYEKLYRSMLQ